MSLGLPPEWHQVEAKAQRVEGLRPETIHAAASTLRTAAANAANHPDKLNAATNGLRDDSWEGESATAFLGYVDKVGKAAGRLHDRLVSAADDLDRLGQDLSDLRGRIGERVHQARSAIEQANAAAEAAAARAAGRLDAVNRQVLGAVPPAQTPDAIFAEASTKNSATATTAGEDLDGLLEKADALLDQVSDGLTQDIGGGYSQLPPHGAMPALTDGRAGTPNETVTTPPPSRQSTGHSTPVSGAKASTPPSRGHTGGGGGGGGSGAGSARPPATVSDGPSGSPPAIALPGDVDAWVREAVEILRAHGVPVTDADIARIKSIIQHESAGNPHAINKFDSNAAAGHPSKGLMQTIDSTFRAYKLPGHDDIYNPVDNIIAGVRYIYGRYGDIQHTPGLTAMSHGGAYRGY
ncbi:transglycosylase SLT domain-containing protein [Amycolatopsis sp. NPDC059657]|uniref:transglycosylase SLT domain-containing protein n=1 Tax=Amycolatopsis sp. NPDC059657 TaxID=3346899 RepID=UPI00366B795A